MVKYNENQKKAESKGRQYFGSLFRGQMDYVFMTQEFCCFDAIGNYRKEPAIFEIKTAKCQSEESFRWGHALELKKYFDMMAVVNAKIFATRAFFFEFYEKDRIVKIWELSAIDPDNIKTGTRRWPADQADGGRKKVLKNVIELNDVPFKTMKF